MRPKQFPKEDDVSALAASEQPLKLRPPGGMRYWCENCFCCSSVGCFPEKVADVRLESFFSLTNPLSSRRTRRLAATPPRNGRLCTMSQDTSSTKMYDETCKNWEKTLFNFLMWEDNSTLSWKHDKMWPSVKIRHEIAECMARACVSLWPSTNYDICVVIFAFIEGLQNKTYIHTQIKKSNFSTLFFPLWALKARRRDSNLEMKAPLFSFLSGGTPCAGEKRSFFLSSSYFYLFSAVQNGFSLLPIFPLLPPACWGKSPPTKVSICTFL